MANLQLKDLVAQGLQLTRNEATLLLPHVLKISKQGALTPNVIAFEPTILTGTPAQIANKTAELY